MKIWSINSKTTVLNLGYFSDSGDISGNTIYTPSIIAYKV